MVNTGFLGVSGAIVLPDYSQSETNCLASKWKEISLPRKKGPIQWLDRQIIAIERCSSVLPLKLQQVLRKVLLPSVLTSSNTKLATFEREMLKQEHSIRSRTLKSRWNYHTTGQRAQRQRYLDWLLQSSTTRIADAQKRVLDVRREPMSFPTYALQWIFEPQTAKALTAIRALFECNSPPETIPENLISQLQRLSALQLADVGLFLGTYYTFAAAREWELAYQIAGPYLRVGTLLWRAGLAGTGMTLWLGFNALQVTSVFSVPALLASFALLVMSNRLKTRAHMHIVEGSKKSCEIGSFYAKLGTKVFQLQADDAISMTIQIKKMLRVYCANLPKNLCNETAEQT